MLTPAEIEAVDRFVTDAMNRGIVPMHVAADLSQYLVDEWSGGHVEPSAAERLAAVEALTWGHPVKDAISGSEALPRRKTHVRVRDLDRVISPAPSEVSQ